jgi:hypothetical protein
MARRRYNVVVTANDRYEKDNVMPISQKVNLNVKKAITLSLDNV